MSSRTSGQRLWTLRSINGVMFGCSQAEMLQLRGDPDQVLSNPDGEIEFHYRDTIYRCFDQEFVECSFADSGPVEIDGVAVLSVYEWLARVEDAVDRARFRISLGKGIAYDYRFAGAGSITVFGAGRWDAIVAYGD